MSKNFTKVDMSKYIFVYNQPKAYFLRHIKGIGYICKAFAQNGDEFCIFEKTDRVKRALNEYDKLKQQ